MVTTGNMTSGALGIFLQRQAVKQFVKSTYLYDMGTSKMLPDAENSYTFNLPDANTATVATSTLTEGITPTESAFTFSQINVTMTQYGVHSKLTDVALKDSPIDLLSNASFELGRVLAENVDQVIQTELLTGTNVIYGGAVTARASLTATDVATGAKLSAITANLRTNAAPTFDGAYVMVAHPHVISDLLTETGNGSFFEVNKYDNATKIFNGEIGRLYGIRVVESPNVGILADAGSGAVDVYPSFVIGRDAYAVVRSQNMTTEIKPLGSAGTADPLNQRASVGMKIRFGTQLLKEEALYRLETASSLGANT